jgi:fructose transport system permease protein
MSDTQEYEKAAATSPTTVAAFATHDRSMVKSIQHGLHQTPLDGAGHCAGRFHSRLRTGPGAEILLALCLTLILQQVQIVGIVGAAQSLVILTAGIDLSVGAIMVLSSVVMGQFSFRYGLPTELAVAAGIACGTICGFINGFLVAVMKLPPFIVTLGMWQIVLATNFLYSANETIRARTSPTRRRCCSFSATRLRLAEPSSPMA